MGALTQLVAYGAQDAAITSDPEITFFKSTYRRHTNFAMESIEQTFNGTVDFGRRVTTTIARSGDLIYRTYLQVTLPALSGGTQAWVNYIGEIMIKQIEIEIGGSLIDRQYGQWLHIWSELTLTKSQEDSYKVMVGETDALTTQATSTVATTLYVPTQFWYSRNAGLALPLIALQFHDVKMNVEFRPWTECVITSVGTTNTPSGLLASIWCDYIFLDTAERGQFARSAHEYLIDQVQFPGVESYSASSISQKMNFNHPVSEIIWVVQSQVAQTAKDWTNFTTTTGVDPVVDAKILINGSDRFNTRLGSYFNLVQPFQHHTRGPAVGIYNYSFAIRPEEHQPSGSCNFSRIDNANLKLTLVDNSQIYLYTYARNKNIFRVVSGMGGLAYAS